MEKSLYMHSCSEVADMLGISKAQLSYHLSKNKKLSPETKKQHITTKGRTKMLDIFIVAELFKLTKQTLTQELQEELDSAVADEEMDKVLAGKNIQVELDMYKNLASSLQTEVEELKYDVAVANDQIKSLESLLQKYYEDVGKALQRNIELLEKLEPIAALLPSDIDIKKTPIDRLEAIVKQYDTKK